jgi:hypothetical protein
MTEKFITNSNEKIVNGRPMSYWKNLGKNPEQQEDSKLMRLWRKYNFAGNPPKAGSPVEERLIQTCENYIDYLIKRATTTIGSSQESSFTNSSERHQRDLHNQIALMVIGANRSDLPIDIAEKIQNFACELAYGATLAEYQEMYLNNIES